MIISAEHIWKPKNSTKTNSGRHKLLQAVFKFKILHVDIIVRLRNKNLSDRKPQNV